MSAGTLTLPNNSDAVTGSGTAFSTEIAAGDFIVVTVGGIPYTLPVKAVGSNTALTLVSKYTGPTQSGTAWYAVPRVAMNLVTAALVTQGAEALRGLNYDKQNWQSIFSGTGTVTVKLPDGSTWSGPAWNGIATTIAGKLDKNQNLNDLPDKPASRASLGLGTSATSDTTTSQMDATTGRLLKVGDWGIGSTSAPVVDDANNARTCGIYSPGGATGTNWAEPFYPALVMNRGNNYIAQIQVNSGGHLASRRATSSQGWTPWATHWNDKNTTKASDGTLKAASPVARIVKSREETQRKDLDEKGFTWCGCGTANEEAEGIKISRLDVGVYVLTGSAGLASEGWQLLPPMDPGGMGEQGVVEAEQTESGGLTIRLFKRKYMLSDDGEILKTKGEPMDVPVNSWIDIRLDMPESSAWNQRQAKADKILEISDMENQQDASL